MIIKNLSIEFDLSTLIDLERRIELLTNNHLDFLLTYFMKNINLFTLPIHIYTKKDDEPKLYNYELKPGKLSTCFALLSLLNSDISIERIISKFRTESKRNIFEYFYNLLLTTNESWKHSSMDKILYDIYNTPFKLIFIKKYEELLKDEFIKLSSDDLDNRIQNQNVLPRPFLNKKKIISEAISEVIRNFSTHKEAVKFSDEFDFSAFLSYWNIEALFYWLEILVEYSRTPNNTITKDTLKLEKLEELLYNIFVWAKNQLYRQRSFYIDEDNIRIDPVRSIYCLLIYKKYHEFYLKYYQNQKTTKYRIGKYDASQVKKFSTQISKHLVKDGFWKRYLPVATRHFTESHIYPFPLTTIERFLENTEIGIHNLNDYLPLVEQVLTWIERNERRNYGALVKVPSEQVSDQIVYRGSYSGWKTHHSINPYGHPECWSTALVFDALWSISKTIKKVMTKSIINQFDGIYNDEFLPNSFIERWDSKIHLKDYPNVSLKKFIYYNIILPRLKFKKSEYWKVLPNSFLLYGPPGTGKSSLVKSIAFSIGWSFVRIDTSIFLSSGLDKAGLKVMEVFKQLTHLDKTVILFDEIDEIIKSRNDSSASIENKLLTNTVLTLLNDLAENKKVMIFIATNYSIKIDPAITRPGRIDFKILINYPNVEEFVKYFKVRLKHYIEENKNVDGKLVNYLEDFKGLDHKEIEIKIDKMGDMLQEKFIKILKKRLKRQKDPSDTDITFLRSRLFFNNIIEKMEKTNTPFADLPTMVEDYFGSIQLDRDNQISESSISGSLYPLDKMNYDLSFDKKLRVILEKYYPRDNLQCMIESMEEQRRRGRQI